MGKEFELTHELTVDATPEQVWEAIATGPGIDSWFLGRSAVTPGAGGKVTTDFAGEDIGGTITGWEPMRRLAYGGDKAEDGRFVAYEFLIEGQGQSSTVVRMVTSGFLPQDDWADEFHAMGTGILMYFRTLGEYLANFAGRTATPVTAFGPVVEDWETAWIRLTAALGLPRHLSVGTPVTVSLPGVAEIDGVVDYATDETLGLRTGDAIFRFIKGFYGPFVLGHHYFTPIDRDETEAAWTAWLATLA
jgi:uncharacterized protein YndB with AHSA1/START domain